MKLVGFSGRGWPFKIFWLVMFGVSLFIVCSAIVGAFSFSFTKLVVLAVSVFVSVLISRYQAKIPHTRTVFSAKHIFAFWGIIWLGVGGGVLLGASASLANYLANRDNKKRTFFNLCSDIVCVYLAAIVFHTASGNSPNFQGRIIADDLFVDENVAAAACLMAATHFFANALFSYFFYKLDGDHSLRSILDEALILPFTDYLLSVAASILLYFVFLHFGIEFGLVIVPIAVIGNLAYKVHTRRLAQKTRQISDASRIHLATVEALATAIDARDQVGIGHVRRTQIYAIGIGEILELSDDEINALRTGALLHDIGKLAVPDHILNKPGRLTPAELEKTKIHSSVGASILEKVGFSSPVIPTVKYHHECWDGSGYPERLRGESIPLTARILAVADAYDALRGARPYRPPVSRDEACAFLREGAGSQFDPKIVSVFLKNLRRFEAEVDAQGLSYKLGPESERSEIAVLRDIGGQSYVDQIKRANREVFTLYELARDFSSSVNLPETLALFTKKVGEFVPFDTCAVYLLNESGEFADCVHAKGANSLEFVDTPIRVGEGITGSVLKKRQAVQTSDAFSELSFLRLEFDTKYSSVVSLPLIANETLIGAVTLYSAEITKYGEEHLRLLETIARIASDAISKSVRHAETESHALTDPMTGLPNARSLQIQFEKEVGRANRNGSSFQVLMLDLDGFKAVNDTYGHKAGDQMLTEIGKIIGLQLRDYDFLARYGGDEFVALVPDTQSSDVADLCARIEKAVAEFRLSVGDDAYAGVGVSLGSSCYPNQGATFDEIIIAADRAMYAVKSVRKRQAEKLHEILPPVPKPLIPIDTEYALYSLTEEDLIHDPSEDGFAIEVDDEHIISAAIN